MCSNKKDNMISQCAADYRNLGWGVKISITHKTEDGTEYTPDLTLYDSDHNVLGYVECVDLDKLDEAAEKYGDIKFILEKTAPSYFVITNGYLFEQYYNGVPAKVMTTPVSYDSYSQYRRLSAYVDAYKKMMKNRGKDSQGNAGTDF